MTTGFTDWCRDRVIKPPLRAGLLCAAKIKRRTLRHVCFIGVTGSCAKTTTKNLIAAVLAEQYSVQSSPGTFNGIYAVADTLLRTKRSHAYCVQELGISPQGDDIQLSTSLLQPQVGVVTHIMRDHSSTLQTKASVALAKQELIQSLHADGLAVLNVDEPLIHDMRNLTQARVVTFGLSDNATVRAEYVRGAWPDTLSCDVIYHGERYTVSTLLYGKHFVHTVLAAFTVGVSLGVAPEQVMAAIAKCPPERARLSSQQVGGVTYMDDSWKATYDSVPAALEFLREAKASRKVFVLGTMSDYSGSRNRKYRDIISKALEFTDLVVVINPFAQGLTMSKHGYDVQRVRTYNDVVRARNALRSYLREGDLVFIKGSGSAHLDRLYLPG